MKRTSPARHPYLLPVKPPAPEPSTAAVAGLADLVEAGQVVEACLSDGTFALVMAELNRRGIYLAPRSDRQKQAEPFLLRVRRVEE